MGGEFLPILPLPDYATRRGRFELYQQLPVAVGQGRHAMEALEAYACLP